MEVHYIPHHFCMECNRVSYAFLKVQVIIMEQVSFSLAFWEALWCHAEHLGISIEISLRYWFCHCLQHLVLPSTWACTCTWWCWAGGNNSLRILNRIFCQVCWIVRVIVCTSFMWELSHSQEIVRILSSFRIILCRIGMFFQNSVQLGETLCRFSGGQSAICLA